MADAKKLSAQYGKLAGRMPISDAEYALKYAISLTKLLSKMSITLIEKGITGDRVLTTAQKKLVKILLNYKTPILKKILANTTKDLNASHREAVAYDSTNMDSVNKEMAEATKYLFREEIMFCIRYALDYRRDPGFDLKQARAEIKKSTLLKPMLKRAVLSILPFRTSDLRQILKQMGKK